MKLKRLLVIRSALVLLWNGRMIVDSPDLDLRPKSQFVTEQSAGLGASRQKLVRGYWSDSDDSRSRSKFRQLDDSNNHRLK